MNMRTCLVTGQKHPIEALLRFTIQSNTLVFDGKTKNPGRGGYVLPEQKEKLPHLKKKIEHFLRANSIVFE